MLLWNLGELFSRDLRGDEIELPVLPRHQHPRQRLHFLKSEIPLDQRADDVVVDVDLHRYCVFGPRGSTASGRHIATAQKIRGRVTTGVRPRVRVSPG
jgi:hypothetical protein